MGNKSVGRLVSIGGNPVGESTKPQPVGNESLWPLYEAKNGFYAFESALFVRPSGGGSGSVEWWNGQIDWRNVYADLPENATFFAEDVFGFQFINAGEGFFSFDPETAELSHLGNSVEEWARSILDDYEALTGFRIAHAWQSVNGPLWVGYRLAPSVPFMLGGEYKAESLRAKPDLELASFRAKVYTQTKDLPDGSSVRLILD
jgi:hypothetical protein